ncbi:MAG: hypothetical protein NT118_06420 [Lentisphaerae bacterium]|nr:hypothetical protein [Lentisphaerota bacterium]
MNKNAIFTKGFSNPDSEALYKEGWPGEPLVAALFHQGWQCGGCDFFALFNEDYGLCFNSKSRHHTETVFEHFTCREIARTEWDIPHGLGQSKKERVSEHQLEWISGEWRKRQRK